MRKKKKKKDNLNRKIERICSAFCYISIVFVFLLELRDRWKNKTGEGA